MAKEEAEAETEEKEDKKKKKKKKDKKKKGEEPEGEGGEAKPEGEGEGGGGEGDAEGEGAPKKSKKKLIIILVLVVLLLVGGGAGAYFAGLFGSGSHEEHKEGEVGADGQLVNQVVYYTLPEFLVNLNSSTKQASFLKTTVIIELTKQTDVPLVEANLPRLQDAINTYLRELRPSDLAGSAGIQRLREELALRANKTLAPVKINDVLFKEIVVQ